MCVCVLVCEFIAVQTPLRFVLALRRVDEYVYKVFVFRTLNYRSRNHSRVNHLF